MKTERSTALGHFDIFNIIQHYSTMQFLWVRHFDPLQHARLNPVCQDCRTEPIKSIGSTPSSHAPSLECWNVYAGVRQMFNYTILHNAVIQRCTTSCMTLYDYVILCVCYRVCIIGILVESKTDLTPHWVAPPR